jgi:hypothetical protein
MMGGQPETPIVASIVFVVALGKMGMLNFRYR